jgi:hypothetical protein
MKHQNASPAAARVEREGVTSDSIIATPSIAAGFLAMLMILTAIPAFPNSAFAGDVTLAWDANTDANLAGYKVYFGIASRQYGTPIDAGLQTSYTVTGLAAGTYYFAVTAYSTSGQESGFSNEVVYDAGTVTETAPAITITVPTAEGSFTSSSATLSVGGTASDTNGITQITWANSGGGSGTAAGTTEWSISGIVLISGTNTITVTVQNASGMTSSATLVVTYTAPSDTIPPTVTITSPTSSATYTSSSVTLDLGGTASSDNMGISQVTWSSSGGGSGTASGTIAWSIPEILLANGSNTITVTAWDNAGLTCSATLVVTYSADTTAPTIAITSPTSSATYTASSETFDLSGTASDNTGVSQVTWSNSGGGSGTASGTTSWTISGITLAGGTNAITVTAIDEAGNSRAAKLTVTYDKAPPVISSVTSSTIRNTAATIAWTTDEVSDTQVDYGLSTSYGSTSDLNPSLTKSHSQSLSGLTANTTYHFCVKSKDASGNLATSADYTFKTANLPDLTTGLVAAYGFNEGKGSTVDDASGNSRTATLKNCSWTTSGKYGAALSFNGNNSFLSASSLGLPATNSPQTIAYWAYTTSKITGTQSAVTIASTAQQASIQPGFKDAKAGVLQFGNVWLIVAVQPASKAWHHFAYTYDGQTHCLYIDGKQVGTSTVVPKAADPTAFEIGRGVYGKEYFKGIIDEVVVYDRALSLTAIQALMTIPTSDR